MLIVDADNVSLAGAGGPILENVSVAVSAGDRTGIVGLNGAGKSTLLRVLTGELEPDSGEVRRGRSATISMLAQAPELPPGPARNALGDSWEADAVLDRLGMTERATADTTTLSGGEIRRVALARALVAPTDLLVLDEPTNHLDIDAIDWLEERLAAFNGALLLVTHDRHLLDRVTNRILEVSRGAVHAHDGGYATYLENRAERAASAEQAEAVRRNLARREQAWLRRGAKARTRKSKAHIARAEAVINTRAEEVERAAPMPLHQETPRLGNVVVELEGVGARIEGRELFAGFDYKLDPRERLGIVGPNGAGKSTLLNIMAGRREPDGGRVVQGSTVHLSYFDQVGAALDPEQRVRDALTNGQREPDWRDTALLEAFWFDKETQWAPIGRLSGGERRRFQLVLTLREQPNVLLLDEPTNDLDLDTLRALEDFLEDWPGALVTVSHDRAFLERTVDSIVVIENGTAVRHPGGAEAWVEARRAARRRGHAGAAPTSGGGAAAAGSKAKSTAGSKAKSGRSASTIRHELKATEKQMAKLEARKSELTGQLEATTDHEALAGLGSELADLQAELDAVEERWLELSTALEDR